MQVDKANITSESPGQDFSRAVMNNLFKHVCFVNVLTDGCGKTHRDR